MEEKKPVHSEEIDLFALFRPFARLFGRMNDDLANLFRVLKANLLLFVSIILVITGLGFSLRYYAPSSYVTTGTFASRILPVKYCDLIIQGLNEHTGEALMAEELHLDPAMAANILSISMTPVDAQLDTRDSTLRSFTLRLRLRKMDGLDSIQRALIGYFENNEYAAKQKEQKRISLLALRADIIAKIASLDSLSPIVNSSIIPRSTGQGIILGQPIDPVNVYKQQVTYYQQRIEIEKDLTNLNGIETVKAFFKVRSPNYPNFDLILMISFAIGLLLAISLTPALGKNP